MPAPGYTNVGVRQELVPKIRQFQVLAIGKQGRVLTLTETIALAIELATKELEKEH